MLRNDLLMLGPDINGLGGISRIAKIWRGCGLFDDYNVRYISTVTDDPVNKNIFLLKAYLNFLRCMVGGYYTVYLHTSSFNSFRRKALFLMTALCFGKRVVLHIHPSHFYEFVTSLTGWEKGLTFFLLRRLSALVVLTEEMKNNMMGLFPGKAIYVLRNPVDMGGMVDKKGCTREDNRLLYLGWYIKEKGVYELVDAIEIVLQKGTKVTLEYFGTKQIDQLRTYVKDKGLDGIISVNGWIDDEGKFEKLFCATALVLPTYSEGIPNVILEAMATHTPIISTLVGGLKEVLRDGENAIIVQPANTIDLAEKIERCLADKKLRERIAMNGYEQAKELYDAPVVKEQFRAVIGDICC